MNFHAIICMDGSGGKSPDSLRKRPLYRLLRCSAEGEITRCLLGKRTALDFLVGAVGEGTPESLTLLAADLPIGLPAGYPDVYSGHSAFLPWLEERGARLRSDHGGDWQAMLVAGSVADQSGDKPFVDKAVKGDKARGNFPQRVVARVRELNLDAAECSLSLHRELQAIGFSTTADALRAGQTMQSRVVEYAEKHGVHASTLQFWRALEVYIPDAGEPADGSHTSQLFG